MSANCVVALLGTTAILTTASAGSVLPIVCVAVVLYLWSF